ncbi:MAG: YncE family protein [Caulobacteraceae bacterium]
MRSFKQACTLAGSLAATLWLWAAPVGAAEAAAPLYRSVSAVPLGAPDRWDYVVFDPGQRRVFVAHSDRVDVIDARTSKLVGAIRDIPGGTHGIAIAARTGRGYTDDGRAGEVVAFDLRTLAVGKRLPADTDADAIAFDPTSGHVFVVSGEPGTVTVVDPAANSVVATVRVGEKLEYAVSGDNGKLYVNGNGRGDLVRIDTRINAVDAHWKLDGCDRPKGLAIDRRTHRLFASCVNDVLVVVDADTGAQVAKLPIGHGSDAVAFDPVRKRVLSSNGDGALSIIAERSPDHYEVIGSLRTAVTGRTMGIDPRTGRIYIAAADVAGAGRGGVVPGSLKLLVFDPVDRR